MNNSVHKLVMVLGNKVSGKMVPWEKIIEKMVPCKKGLRGKKCQDERSPEKWSPGKKVPGKWSLEKCPPKIVLRQKNARKFERILQFLSIDFTTHTKRCLTFTSRSYIY